MNIMKRLISKVSLAFAFCATLASCVEQMPEINETLVLGRCLSPTETTAPIDREDGKTVAFTWSESKGATQYTIEIFEGAEDADPSVVFEGTPLYTETPKSSPFKKELPSDKFYFARVKAQAPDSGVEDSKWVEFPYPIGTYEVKSNLWPMVAQRTASSLTIEWKEIDGDRVDHVRVSPNPDDASKAYKRYDVAASEGETVQTVIDGLNPSVKYTVAVHFKSANRGEVLAWTRPSLDNPTEVNTSEALNTALADGAPVIKIAYSDTPYDLRVADASGEMKNVTVGVGSAKSMVIYGNATEDGKLPVLSGVLNFPHGLVDIRVESVKFDGNGYSFERPIVISGVPATDETPVSYGNIEIVNCEISGYKCGIFYYNSATGTVNIAKVLLNNLNMADILGDGGDCIDFRAATEIGSLEISECTFYDGVRDFLRIDKKDHAKVGTIKVVKNTFCNIANAKANKALLYVRAPFDAFEFSDNLIMHSSNAEKSIFACNEVPTAMSNNWFYKVGPAYWAKDDDNPNGKGKLAQSAAIAGGGQILSSDPCYDSAEGNLYVKNAAALEAKVGDPRWLQTYKPVVEDLTLIPVSAGKSWNLMDTKTFGKTLKVSCVRDGLRFIVGANPFKVSEKGLEFSAAGTVEALGVPSDAAIAFMVDTPGTVILSSIKSNTGSSNGHITVAVGPADGSGAKVEGSVNVGAAKAMVALPNIVAGEPQIVYLYGCSSVIVTALQWTDQVASGGTPVLTTPAVAISHESVDDEFTGEVKLSWDEVSAAGSYKIYMNIPADAEQPEAYEEVTTTEYVLPLSKLGTGKFTFSVQACPASDDMSREPSELSEPIEFKYLETLKPVAVETVWGDAEFKYIADYWGELGASGIDQDFVLKNLGYLAGGGKLKTGTTGGKNRVQFNSTGSAGTKCNLQIKVAGPGKLYVTAVSSGDAEQYVAVAIGSQQVGEPKVFPDKTKEPTTQEYDLSDAKAGDIINIYRTSSGVNVLEIKWVPSQVAATQEYKMTLSATAGVLSTNITGIPSSWKEADATWTAKDDSGVDEITFTGNVYYSNSAEKNIVWYFNKSKAETHVTATGLGMVKKVVVYPNSTRDPKYLKCTYGTESLAATEPVGTKSATITFDFEAAGIVSDTFRIDFNATDTNVEVGKVEIVYEK